MTDTPPDVSLPPARAAVSEGDLRPALRIRSVLEAYAVGHLRNSSQEDWLASLRAFLPALKVCALQGDHEVFHRTDMALHGKLIELTGIPTLLSCWKVAAAPTEWWVAHVKKAYWPSLMALYHEHCFLLNAWASPYDEIAEKATHLHIEAGWHRVKAASGIAVPGDGGDPVERAAAFISTHFGNQLSVSWIAAHVSYVSTRHLTRLFKEQKGISPQSMIRQVRMEHAAEILLTKAMSLAMIARHCGYKNQSHFITDFRKYFGMTPNHYRQTKHLDNTAGDEKAILFGTR